MAESGLRAALTAAALILAVAAPPARADTAPIAGASPGESAAIHAYCGNETNSLARNMCQENQLMLILREGRRPDMSVASAQQRASIADACSGHRVPGERFACERQELARAGLPVRNEPGGGALHADLAALPGSPGANLLREEQPAAVPFFSLEKWRLDRPQMPPERSTQVLQPEQLYEKVAPSIYMVVASDHAIELVSRIAYSQGSAVAITDHVLLTNCHVVAGRPQIGVSQDGATWRARLVYADPAGDRCFLQVDGTVLHPVQGVRKLDDIRVGETVYSIGNPAGLERSFGEGLVSGIRNAAGVAWVQNSAPSWHGSSGGGLFDSRGNLVGITTAISTVAANMAFAIAASEFWP
jgi:hypothetical protein